MLLWFLYRDFQGLFTHTAALQHQHVSGIHTELLITDFPQSNQDWSPAGTEGSLVPPYTLFLLLALPTLCPHCKMGVSCHFQVIKIVFARVIQKGWHVQMPLASNLSRKEINHTLSFIRQVNNVFQKWWKHKHQERGQHITTASPPPDTRRDTRSDQNIPSLKAFVDDKPEGDHSCGKH